MDETRLNLTRRFRTASEAREEAETNLCAGSLWVPYETSDDRPALLRAVAVLLVLPDGGSLEPLRGRVSCVAPNGCAVVLDDLPSALVVNRLLGGEMPPAPEASAELAPEDAPPLPAGLIADSWQPIVAPPIVAAVAPLPEPPATEPFAPPAFVEASAVEDELPDLKQPNVPLPPAPPPAPPEEPVFTTTAAIDAVAFDPPPAPAEPAPRAPSPLDAVVFDASAPSEPIAEPVPTPPAAAEPVREPMSFDSPAPSPDTPEFIPASEIPDLFPTPWDGADFPASRATPVPAVASEAGMWGDDALVTPAAPDNESESNEPESNEPESNEPESNEPESNEPAAESKPLFSVQFATPELLEAAWMGELGAGRVLVATTGEPPALDARVEVTLVLPEVGMLVLEGTVVHRTSGGAGIRLDLDSTTRALIESALPGPAAAPPPQQPESPSPEPVAVPVPVQQPESPSSEPVAMPVPVQQAVPAPEPPRRPTLELRKSPTGRPEVVLAFETLADFAREYETNIRRGGVLVPTAERPPVRSVVEVVFSLLGGKREVRVLGEVVLHGPTGIGVQLSEISQTTRVEIDSLLAAAGPRTPASAPAVVTPSPAPPTSPAAVIAPPPPPASSSDAAQNAPAARGAFAPSGSRLEGELVEVMREAEVEGEAGSGSSLGTKASWLKVLAHLQATRSNGVLQAIRKAETKSYVIFQGRILGAKGEPSRDDESMLRVIRKHGLAKPGVLRMLERALDRVPDELEALQSAGVWTPAEIDRARRWQVLERAAEVFAWEKGQFKFEPEGDRSWVHPTSGVPVGHVILHGVRSYIRASGEDLARILRPGFDRALRIAPNTGFEPVRVGMADKELKFWAEIDGKKTLRQLLATSPISQAQSHRLIFALCRLGVLMMEKPPAGSGARARDSERVEALKARAIDMKSRDLFGRLSISWMCAAPHVQVAWDELRRELDLEVRTPGPAAEAAREILAIAEDAWKQLMDDRTRRLQRLKLIEDPSRIEAAADMLAERASLLRMQGDIPGAESALYMALDMAPGNPAFQQLLARVRAG